ncbi:Insulin-induced protein 2 protein [Boothiomyces sp. JEL0866]|nr:Insulin-induced protein 2 protein [Boothiomyces sp. JEL0866]
MIWVKAIVLFITGYSLVTVCDYLLQLYHITIWPQHSTIRTDNWVGLSSGFASTFIGLLFPLADKLLTTKISTNWSKMIRMGGAFVGLSYAKLSNGSVSLGITTAFLAIGFWYTFDKTIHGLLMAVGVTFLGSVAISALVNQGAYSFARSEFYGLTYWIPAVLFCSVVVVGAVGRQLDFTFKKY